MIRDVYFDTPGDHALQNRKLSLRIREIGSDALRITLKGPSDPRGDDSGIQQREEIEEEWSKEGLQKVVSRLKENVHLIEKKPIQHEDNYYHSQDISRAINTIKQMGLEQIIQDHVTKRIVRNVISLNNKSQRNNFEILAELAIDCVTYCYDDDNKVLLYEIEVEGKEEDKTSCIPSIIGSALVRTFGSNVLRRWQYSKIATGSSIRELVKSKLLKNQDQTDDSYRLATEDYDRLEQYIVNSVR
jgi:hypothetical protein